MIHHAPIFVFLDVGPLHETEGAVIEILTLDKAGKIILHTPYTVREEMQHPNVPPHAQVSLNSHSSTMQVELNEFEKDQKKSFITDIRGDANPDNIDADLSHIFEAAKYHAKYFITRDKRLMSETRKPKIAKWYPNLSLTTPEEFLKYFKTSL